MTYDEMRIRQAWPYEVKIKHAEKVAREFLEKVSVGIQYGGTHGTAHEAWNAHISVGGLDSITLLCFLRDRFPGEEIKAISRSSLEDKSIQRIHKQLGVENIPGAKSKVSIIQEYGFPVISKRYANKIEKIQAPEREDHLHPRHHDWRHGCSGEIPAQRQDQAPGQVYRAVRRALCGPSPGPVL